MGWRRQRQGRRGHARREGSTWERRVVLGRRRSCRSVVALGGGGHAKGSGGCAEEEGVRQGGRGHTRVEATPREKGAHKERETHQEEGGSGQ